MIKIVGSTRRSFIFPAELPAAFAYYSDLGRILTYLPHISLMRAFAYDQFRVLYNTLELGAYHIRIFCDMHAVLGKEGEWVLRIQPWDGGHPPVRPEAGLSSSTARGYFNSESVFRQVGPGQTEIDYSLQLRSKLPTPLGLRLVPGRVVNHIAESIMTMRIHEIAEGFIERSIEAFPHWLGEMHNSALPAAPAPGAQEDG